MAISSQIARFLLAYITSEVNVDIYRIFASITVHNIAAQIFCVTNAFLVYSSAFLGN